MTISLSFSLNLLQMSPLVPPQIPLLSIGRDCFKPKNLGWLQINKPGIYRFVEHSFLESQCKLGNLSKHTMEMIYNLKLPCCLSRYFTGKHWLSPGWGHACPVQGVRMWESSTDAWGLPASPESCDCLYPWIRIQSLSNVSLIGMFQFCISPAFLNPIKNFLTKL